MPWLEPERAFEFLAGDWSVKREIVPGGVWQGVARFEASGPAGPRRELAYREQGQLALDDGGELSSGREYRWRIELSGLVVLFSDGREFHTLGLDGLARHYCGEDLYEAEYSVTSADSFLVVWHVRGPRKDYRSVGEYCRGTEKVEASAPK